MEVVHFLLTTSIGLMLTDIRKNETAALENNLISPSKLIKY